jgi:GWxTD domain-containing protein
MSVRHTLKVVAVLICLAPVSSAFAQKLDKEEKKWLDEVRPIMLAEEEKTYRELKDKGEREEFRKIFWARRDPNPGTPENEYEVEYKAARTEADTQFRVDRPGIDTDCARVFLLFGKPDEIKPEESLIGSTPVIRKPEVWTYKDRPGQKFAGGQAQIAFEANCTLPQGARMGESLAMAAENKIKNPNLGYKKGSDGKLVKLVDQLPKPSPTQTLLKTPRQDFPLTVERKLLTRLPQGGTYLAFLVHAPAGAVDPAKVVVTGLATDAAGVANPVPDREIIGSASADGSFTGSIGFTLRPGKYNVQVALLDPASGKGSVATIPAEILDETSSDVAVSTIVLKDIQQGKVSKPTDPYAAFAFGDTVFVPQPANAYTPADSLTLITFLYGGQKDATTGKTAVVLSMTLSKDGTPVAKMAEEKFETPASPSIGPIALAAYAPGSYVAEVKVRDEVAKKDFTDKVTFEVRAAK